MRGTTRKDHPSHFFVPRMIFTAASMSALVQRYDGMKPVSNYSAAFVRVYCDTYTIMRQIKGNGLIFVAFLYLNDTTFRYYSYLCSGINNNKLKTRDYG